MAVRIMRPLIGWLWGRQPRIVDYILIAVIAGILTTVIVTTASGGGQDIPSPKGVSTRPSIATSSYAPTRPVTTARAFYAPTGNIVCSLQSESAQCSVASADLTFVIPQGGGSAYTMQGIAVPLGVGSEAPYGSERSDGVIICNVPPENVAAGVTCRDTGSGHGFEASRVASRQAIY
jgi:hypothetical protein